jgi:regulator of replication initiation timing
VEDKESISFEELFDKYQTLLTENSNLKEENGALKARLGVPDVRIPINEVFGKEPEPEEIAPQSTSEALASGISNRSDSSEKIKLFMSLFKGRDDVYAKRWERKQKEKEGYSPSCLNGDREYALSRRGPAPVAPTRRTRPWMRRLSKTTCWGRWSREFTRCSLMRRAGFWRLISMMVSGKRILRP